MLLGRIFGDTRVEAHHTLICVPLNVIHVKTSLVIDSLSVSSRRGYSGCLGIIDTKTIWFVFLLLLPCWRVFFLGSPALHYAGADRLQMVGVRSLHVDRSLVTGFVAFHSLEVVNALFYLRQLVKYAMNDWIQRSTLFIQLSSESCNKMLEIWIKCICLNCVIVYCGSTATTTKDAGRRKKNKEPREP